MTKEISFETWMKQVNRTIFQSCGLGVEDIPDYDYWSNWNAGVSPEQTAEEALDNAGWSF
jgi:hypothetical protein